MSTLISCPDLRWYNFVQSNENTQNYFKINSLLQFIKKPATIFLCSLHSLKVQTNIINNKHLTQITSHGSLVRSITTPHSKSVKIRQLFPTQWLCWNCIKTRKERNQQAFKIYLAQRQTDIVKHVTSIQLLFPVAKPPKMAKWISNDLFWLNNLLLWLQCIQIFHWKNPNVNDLNKVWRYFSVSWEQR